jgi:predicted esterase
MVTMTDEDIRGLQRELRRLYSQHEYAQALELIDRRPGIFSQPGMLYHWRMCLAARANDPDRAIAAFGDALDRGYAYPAALIRDDEDLASLQGMVAFEELARRSEARMAEMEREVLPELLVIPPPGRRVERASLLLALHGNSQNARMAATDWAPIVNRGWVLACAQSTQVLTTDAFVWNDMARGTGDVEAMVDTLGIGQAIDPDRVVLGGFSMGGGLAIQVAVEGAVRARGFIAIGPYLPDLASLEPYLEAAAGSGLRGYIVMGLLESPEGQELIRAIPPFLRAHGIPCELEERPGLAHAFPDDFDEVLDRALAFLRA